MQTQLADFVRDTPDGDEARAIVGKCVHCGFCAATCPTYRLLGDELDGPRGRIYLIKQVLEGSAPTAKTQLHLDRCLTCRACETTCPSGVEYGRLVDIGRRLVDERVPRKPGSRLLRAALRAILPRARLFGALLGTGRLLRPLLPALLAERVPARQAVRPWPARSRSRQVLLLAGCVQPTLAPNINGATARVLDALGIEAIVPGSAGCCGAVRHHLGDPDAGLDDARRNIDAWWPHLEAGSEAIVMNASGCGSQVREYAHLLRHDAAYAARAARVSAAACDVAELVANCAPQLQAELGAAVTGRVVFHPPCSLQHGQKVRGAVESLLSALGAEVLPFADAHLCCGGAGTYSMLQPQLATGLRERKLEALLRAGPDEILTANIGCIAHLGVAADVPVRHWIEWLDDALWARHTALEAGQGESG